jgi:hypothetical protein
MDSVSAALHTVRVQHWMATAALVSVLIVPIAIGALWFRNRPGRSRRQQVALGFSTFLAALLYAMIAFVFAVCRGGEIGESGKSQLARAYGAPVIEALNSYHSATHSYPAQLRDLVPGYLSPAALHAPESEPLKYPFEYSRDSSDYELSVRYTGPGMNDCVYRPGHGWHCVGYF